MSVCLINHRLISKPRFSTRRAVGVVWERFSCLRGMVSGMCAFNRKTGVSACHLRKPSIGRRLILRALGVLLLLGAAQAAHAGTVFCSSYPLIGQFHVIDGSSPSITPANLPSSIGIDASCEFKNFPISTKWPSGLTSTLNFKQNPLPTLAIFENVYYSGNMACSNTNTKIWFVNNATYAANNTCQSLFIPVETIGKAIPGPTATIGVPFTYTLTIPVMYDPSTNTYYNNPSPNNLINATVYDDLTATGADMTYVSNTAYTIDTSGGIHPIGPLNLYTGSMTIGTDTITGDTTKHLIFDWSNNTSLQSIPAGTQVVVKLTVVLDNTSTNVAGTQFINTAKWWFGRTIDGVDYEPLPGQSGVSQPMTVAEPSFVVTKTAASASINVGTTDKFTIDAQNVGGSDAWYPTISDNIPAGMCTYNPTSTVTASILHTDGTTTSLSPTSDYTVSWNGGTTSACTLTLTTTSATAKVGPNEHLIITYDGELDAGTSPGLNFSNVAGVTQWFSGDTKTYTSGIRTYTRTLQDASTAAASPDYEDAFTVTSVTQGYYFLKTAEDLTTGALENSVTGLTAFPGDTIRYTLRLQNFQVPTLNNISITDDLGNTSLNPSTAFQSGTLSLVSTDLPAGTYTISPNGGTGGVGQVSINGLSLAGNTQYYITFDIKLANTLTNGTVVKNQATLNATGYTNSASDDPFINGPALLKDGVAGDPTPLTVLTPGALSKTNPSKTWATIGDTFTYQIKVPATPVNVPLYDVKIIDPLASSNADLSFVSASVVSGGTWSLVNTGTATSPVIEDQSTGIDIPAGGQAVINVTVQLNNTSKNVDGLTFNNTAYYTYDKSNGDSTTQGTGGSATTSNMTVYEPKLTASKTVSYTSGKAISSPAVAGDVLQYTVTVKNSSAYATAYDTDVLDALPSNLSLVASSASATINGTTDSSFVATPTTLSSGTLVWGFQNGDGSLDIPPNGTLVLTYQAKVLATNGTPISNSVHVDWTSINGINDVQQRTGDGCGTSTGITDPNNYCVGPYTATVSSTDPTALSKTVVSDTWTTSPSSSTDSTVRIGDTVVYNLAVTLREGTTNNVVVTDALPTGLTFDGTISITPASASPGTSSNPFTYSVVSQPTVGVTGSISWNLGNVDNLVDNDQTNNTLIIQFRARVMNNTLSTSSTPQTLSNSATLTYSIGGTAGTPKTSTTDIQVWQPNLTISKTASPALAPTSTVVSAGENVNYTVSIQNGGTAPAYDPVLQDILPLGMRNTTPVITNIVLTDGTTSTTLPAPYPAASYSSSTGVATWNFDTDAYTILPGYTLKVTYQAKTDSTLGTGMTLTNKAQIQHYYSFESSSIPTGSVLSDRQDYGQTSSASVTLTTAAALALSKQALVNQAAIGQPFTYQITVPASKQSTALYDVHVKDDISLATTGVSLSYVSANAHLVSGAKTWTSLSNISTTSGQLDLVDNTSGGLDIPANDQLIVDITVVLTNDTTNNTPGKSFTNTATYTYDSINDDTGSVKNGAPGSSGAVTIIAPNLILTKSGPASMHLTAPGAFTLNVLNNGKADAWNAVITDELPNTTSGGMCSAAPTISSAGIYDSAGTTLVKSLVSGTDYNVSFVGAPTCTFTITMTSTGVIPAGDHLIINYNTYLDSGTASKLSLTNIAGVTQYKSADPGVNSNVLTYSNTLTDGTPTVTDFQDAFTVVTTAPTLTFTKAVYDVTTSSSGTNAHPGDVLRYTLTIQNTGTVDANNFNLTDDLDNLNSTAMFVPNTLSVSSIPSGATDTSNASGGSKGTGYVSISGLNVAAGSTITIVYTIRLVPVINNGTVVLNQAQIASPTINTQLSDDPNTSTANDPTHTTISSAPKFQIYKTSADLTGSASILLPGDTLRYTITVKNIGTENAVNATLQDQIPANTTYVAGSTTLNGNKVADVSGASPLQGGMLINSPADTTAGHMPANSSSTTTSNVATITFEVTINAGTVSGTVISNQGFLNAAGSASPTSTFDTPSDDPNTPVINDPTLNVVGNVPLIDSMKTVKLLNDVNNNGYVDAGDTLQYTITVTNYGKVQATGVTLTDAVPVNTTYVANSTTLNTLSVPDAAGGVSPLVGGLPISSSDLTPPLPTVGYLSAGGTATIIFDVTVNSTVGAGVTISNQGYVTSNEQAKEPTDADGIDSNGDQPTVIVTGNAQLLTISKQVSVVGGGSALAGGQLEYTVTVTNAGLVPATNVTISDNLDEANAGYLSYVSGSATLNGSTVGISYSSPTLTADYSTTYGNLPVGQSVVLRFRADINAGLPIGTTVTNIAHTYWNLNTQTASASASVSLGGTPGSAALNGKVWHDSNYNKTYDSGETQLSSWTVQLFYKGQLLATTLSDASGFYHFTGLAANDTVTSRYKLVFLAPGASANTATLGNSDSSSTNSTYTFTDGPQYIDNIIVKSGDSLTNLNMPITPNGVVYNSITRAPVAGATLTMVNASSGQPLDSACFVDPSQQNQVTLSSGYYKFDLNFAGSNCPAGGDYLIKVTSPTGYNSGESVVITPKTNSTTGAYSVPLCPNDAIATPAGYCEVQTFTGAPALSIAAGSLQTNYYLKLTLDNPAPGSNQIYNNPIPIDPNLGNALSISKVSDKVNVTRGELVPYTITIKNTLPVTLSNATIYDDFPAGFKYVAGSARVNGVPTAPNVNGLELSWPANISSGSTYTIKLLLIVGAGVHEGKYVNRAHVYSNETKGNASPEATATVRVVPDATFDCSDIIGKVFDDKNLNGRQDKGEEGLGGVRLATVRGYLITTDPHGRFHLSCAAVPNEDRGSNFILKLDPRTLPSGYRVTTENPRVERLTRGKAIDFSFGAALEHVVTLDIANGVFKDNSTQMRSQWVPRLALLITQLRKKPSLLRLTYLADVENKSLVNDRIAAIKDRIMKRWKQVGSYKLTIETEIFWRHGGPVDNGGFSR